MELRFEFAKLADREGANMSLLCRRFEISRSTGYKWLRRYRAEGKAGLQDRSRRPHSSPAKTPEHIEEAVCALRDEHPAWGSQLRSRGGPGSLHDPAAAHCPAEAASVRKTPTRPPATSASRKSGPGRASADGLPWATSSWKAAGRSATTHRAVVDDHSRFAVALKACGDQQRQTVQKHLRGAFGTLRAASSSGRCCRRSLPPRRRP